VGLTTPPPEKVNSPHWTAEPSKKKKFTDCVNVLEKGDVCFV